jgi:protein TonB
VRTASPFLLSVGIHLALIALFIGAISALNKTAPVTTEKISLKILMQTHNIETTVPIQPKIQPLQKNSKPIVHPKQSNPLNQPIKPLTEQNKPSVAIAQHIVPSVSSPLETPKVPESIPVPVAKASPLPPPKQQENYEEENLGRIRAILMERLIYPKNALRLKQQGEVTVIFTLETNRAVSQISIFKSSGFELLDDAAKNLIINSANEFPKPSKPVQISVPVGYKLH